MTKKLTFALLLVMLFAAKSFAADNSFWKNAWGWAACSDEAGTAYDMRGGMSVAQPKTIVLTSNGGDMRQTIINAIANYDIIVLDGSKGEFMISSLMQIVNAKNKTIVGRNNATLYTQFFLTEADLAYLKKQNLEGLSSTSQHTGTLPDGTKITCDERAFYTKKAMMELQYQKTGVYSLPNRAGIFELSASDQNIIIRNLNLVGPGSVDIDGVDLITNLEAKNVWIDHCTFQDSQDGALDSKRCDYSTYTFNHFFYTERSYSHAYTNGCGWADGQMVLHLTFACNVWGKGCMRRLPQTGDCYVHLVNNFYNCPGNSVGMTLNDNTKALVEYNFAATGVKDPISGSGANRNITAYSNTGTGFVAMNLGARVTVPYTYSFVKAAEVKAFTDPAGTGELKAGNSLTYFMPGEEIKSLSADNFGFWNSSMDVMVGSSGVLPVKNLAGALCTFSSQNEAIATISADGKVSGKAEGSTKIVATVTNDPLYGNYTAEITVNVKAASGYGTLQTWNFKKRSDETTANLTADADNWTKDGTNFSNPSALKDEPLLANGVEIAETKGLRFTMQPTKFVIYSNSIRVNKEGDIITIPGLKQNDKVILTWKSANSSSQRGFNCDNLSVNNMTTDGTQVTKDALVLADGDVNLVCSGGIYVYVIEVQRQGLAPDAVENVKAATTEKAKKYLEGNTIVIKRAGKKYGAAANEL